MKENDVVKMKNDKGRVKKGALGTIVAKYDESRYLVEFIDAEGYTIDLLELTDTEIELIKKYS